VLSEEDYTGTLTSIITRDYFPALPALNRDAAILQKRFEGDVSSVIAIRRGARQVEAREELLNQLEETEEIIALHHGGIRKRARPLDRETIDGFHQRVTSEDNAEFEENMRREISEKTQRMNLIYQTKGENFKKLGVLLTNNSVDNLDETSNITKDRRQLNVCNTPLLASDYFNAPVERIQSAGTNAHGENRTTRNALFFTPNHLEHSTLGNDVHEKIEFGPQNSTLDDSKIMPPPMSITKSSSIIPVTNSLCINALEGKSDCLVEYKVKPKYDPNSIEKMIVPSNTRFDYQSSSHLAVPSCSKSIEIGSNETSLLEYETDASTTTDLDATPASISLEREKRINHKERSRNTFVAMTPTIIPGRDDDSPLVTWGRVASTPLALGLGDEKNETSQPTLADGDQKLIIPNSFQLPQENEKEIAAKKAEVMLSKRAECYHQSSNKLTHGEREVQGIENRNSSKNATVIGRTSLTPAARSLLERAAPSKSKCFLSKATPKATPRSSSSFGTALRNSYMSSSNSISMKSGRSHKSSTINKATPLFSTLSTIQPATFFEVKRKGGSDRTSTSGLLKE
jgi:Nuclear protein Es2.